MIVTSSCRLVLSQTIKPKSEKKLTEKIEFSNVWRVTDAAVKAHCEPGLMTTVMLHSIMHPAA